MLEVDDRDPRSEVLIATAFKNARIGMALIDPTGRLLVVNPAMRQIFGFSEPELLTMSIGDLSHPDDGPANLALLGELVRGEREGYELRKSNRHAAGHWVPVLVAVNAVRNGAGELRYIVGQIYDLTEQLAAERALAEAESRHIAELERQARTDALTGLPNRAVARSRLIGALDAAAAGHEGVAVAMCDVDHFKVVNDSYGHTVGDDLLAAVGSRLSEMLAATSTVDDEHHADEVVARFGGDEFVIVLRNASSADAALRRVAQLVDAAGRHLRIGARRLRITLSSGLMYIPPGQIIDSADAVAGADTALYEAKRRGRDRIVLFDDSMRSAAIAEAEMGSALRDAIDLGEITCAYQPILDSSGRLDHVEALARWVTRGEHVPPGVFVPLAERTGLVTRLGEAVAGRALAEVARWGTQHHRLPVALNVAGTQLDDSFVGRFFDSVDAHGLLPADIRIEITESTLLDPTRSLDVLSQLHDGGIELAIDDFGTGHSSFAYLRDLPVGTVKLDRSFVHAMSGPSDRATSVVAGMIDLAHRMGLRVVAEGIEDHAQFERLVGLGCDLFQGYLLGRPGPLEAAASDRGPVLAVRAALGTLHA